MEHQQSRKQININESKMAIDSSPQNAIESKLADFFANTIATVSQKKRTGKQLNESEQELLAALEEILAGSES
ncbi:hypothetical protein [Thalassoporum mexicanum]|uniref:hypothetical protein n=1 Tax=Thalassoporum mexicanum TaxID=3457544 RepID=UPI0002F20716|nr:hypothetical protein [Pseudanabaena sp. PCC 7367]